MEGGAEAVQPEGEKVSQAGSAASNTAQANEAPINYQEAAGIPQKKIRKKILVSELIAIICTFLMLVLVLASVVKDFAWNSKSAPGLEKALAPPISSPDFSLKRGITFDMVSLLLILCALLLYIGFLIVGVTKQQDPFVSVAVNAIAHIVSLYGHLVIFVLLLFSLTMGQMEVNELLYSHSYAPHKLFFRLIYISKNLQRVKNTFEKVPEIDFQSIVDLANKHGSSGVRLLWTKGISAILAIFAMVATGAVIAYILEPENPPVVKPINGRYYSPAQIRQGLYNKSAVPPEASAQPPPPPPPGKSGKQNATGLVTVGPEENGEGVVNPVPSDASRKKAN